MPEITLIHATRRHQLSPGDVTGSSVYFSVSRVALVSIFFLSESLIRSNPSLRICQDPGYAYKHFYHGQLRRLISKIVNA